MENRDLKKTHIYVYELPYSERKEFCNIIDLNDKWEDLGKYYNMYLYRYTIYNVHIVVQITIILL